MIILKVLNTSIDLMESSDIYNPNMDVMLKAKLEQRYLGRCFQSMMILEIVKIIRRSHVKMSDNMLTGIAYVNVCFEVSGIQFVPGEILHDCKIAHININSIIAQNKYAGIILEKDNSSGVFKALEIDHRIPVIIQSAKYTPNETEISVIASPYLPQVKENIIYNISQPMTSDEITKITYLLSLVASEEKLHLAINGEKRYQYFKSVMYPFNVNQKFEQSKLAETYKLSPLPFDLKNITTATGIIMYPCEDNKSNKQFFQTMNSKILDDPIGQNAINHNAYAIFACIINEYLMYLQALRGFVETYSTQESVLKLATYWRLCGLAKK